jgi:hypothetical protein
MLDRLQEMWYTLITIKEREVTRWKKDGIM